MEILSRICLQLGITTFLRAGEIHSIVIENKGPLYILMVLTSQLAAAPPSGHHSLAHGIFLRVLCSLLKAPASHLIALSSVSSIPPRLTLLPLRVPLVFLPRKVSLGAHCIFNPTFSISQTFPIPCFCRCGCLSLKPQQEASQARELTRPPRMWQELWPLTTQVFCARVWLKTLSSLCSPSLQSSVPFHNSAWGYCWEHLVH